MKDARVVFYGAGSSAVGVATSIASYIHLKGGVSMDAAKKACLQFMHNQKRRFLGRLQIPLKIRLMACWASRQHFK